MTRAKLKQLMKSSPASSGAVHSFKSAVVSPALSILHLHVASKQACSSPSFHVAHPYVTLPSSRMPTLNFSLQNIPQQGAVSFHVA